MFILSLIAYAATGAVTGLLSGLLGLSGGFIAIPCLFFIFRMMDFPPVYLMQLAIGTSLASMVFNALIATFVHHRRGNVIWEIVKKMVVGLCIGSIIGAFIAHILPTPILQLIFGFFAIAIGIYLYRRKELIEGSFPLPSAKILNGVGLGIGGVSNILGIGGGVITVPVLIAYRIPMKRAVGTSAATGVIVTFIGAVAYLIFGFNEAFYPHTCGYIYLPAFAVIATTTVFAAPFGARLVHTIPAIKLRHFFSLALMIIGILMLLR